MYQYILTQLTLTLHCQSGRIIIATATSLLPTLVRCILPLSAVSCQATQARLATPKLPHLIDVAAAPAILRSCFFTTRRETRILVLVVLVIAVKQGSVRYN
jgi:hypothetical protein